MSVNPGIYESVYQPTLLTMPNMLLLIGALAGLFLLFGSFEVRTRTRVAFAGLGLVLAVTLGYLFIQYVPVQWAKRGEAIAEARAAYVESVTDWLESDYGIETDSADAGRLLIGNSVIAEYDGDLVSITLAPLANNAGIGVLKDEITPLEPITSRVGPTDPVVE